MKKNIETAVEAMKIGAADFITKPFNLDRVNHSVATALQSASAGTSDDYAEQQTDWVRYLEDIACGVETKLDSQTGCLMIKTVIERTESIARNLGIPEPHIEDWVNQKRRHIERIYTLDVILDKLEKNPISHRVPGTSRFQATLK